MTNNTPNQDRLRTIYDQKIANGLVSAHYTFYGKADAETLAGEILAIEDAIVAGKVEVLNFHDLRWKEIE